MESRTRSARLLGAISLALALALLSAIVLQDFGGALPYGLFNEGSVLMRSASLACGVVLGLAALLFGYEAVSGRRVRAAAALRGLFVFFVIVEGLVTALDVLVVSAPEGVRLAGPYREAVSAQGTRVFLKAPHAGSPLGLRSVEPHPRVPTGRRVLFLGDSYTEGSGRAFECNFPEVAGAVLRERLGADVAVMNAGVAGYGPRDALALYDYLREEGYHFDAVVLSLFLENDFTDNLPGTERRVVAGINFRFPESAFLRWLHPLNTRSFRYLLFVARASQLRFAADDEVRRGDGRCRPPPAGEVGPGVRGLVERRLEANYRVGAAVAPTSEVAAALYGLAARTAEDGVPLAVVVFPDRILADRELRERLALPDPPEAYALGRLRDFVSSAVPGAALVDTTGVLSGPSEHYRSSDTHLSDVGNVVAGRYVGERLAGLLAQSSMGESPVSPPSRGSPSSAATQGARSLQ